MKFLRDYLDAEVARAKLVQYIQSQHEAQMMAYKLAPTRPTTPCAGMGLPPPQIIRRPPRPTVACKSCGAPVQPHEHQCSYCLTTP